MSILEQVVAVERCIGCGVCVGLCPQQALEIRVIGNGDLSAVPSAVPGGGTCSEGCRVCLDCCPFGSGVHDARPLNRKLFGTMQRFHDDVGHYVRCGAGSRVDASLRRASASGGLTTWCLEELLVRKLVTNVAVVRWARRRAGEPLFEFFSASSPGELRSAAGSVYHPVEISGIVRDILRSKSEKWAIVGVPCLCAAVRSNRALRTRVPYVLGLACGMYQNTFYTELLACRSGIRLSELAGVRYRCKDWRKRADDFGFVATGSGDNLGTIVNYKGLPAFLGRTGFFRQNACNYCMDVFAEAADACFMDAWLPEYEDDNRGTSLVAIRSPALDRVFAEGSQAGGIEWTEVDVEAVVHSQKVHVRRKRGLIHMRLGRRGPATQQPPSLMERVDWKIQRHVQKQSKAAWATHGRDEGEHAFWRAVWVLRILILGRDLAGRLARYLGRRMGALRR